MSPVFRHGRLRLYILKLLDEAPRHGYEIIRLLQDRFLGVYAPSPGTIYPRLSRLEEEGLVTHDSAHGRKVYRLTDAGREELRERLDELNELEREITDSVRDIAREVREDVRETVRSLREDLKNAAQDVRRENAYGPYGDPGREQRQARREDQRRQRERRQEWRRQRERWKQASQHPPWDWDDWSPWTRTGTDTTEHRAALERLLNDFRGEMRGEVRRAAQLTDLDDESVLACREILDDAARRLRAVLRGEPERP